MAGDLAPTRPERLVELFRLPPGTIVIRNADSLRYEFYMYGRLVGWVDDILLAALLAQ